MSTITAKIATSIIYIKIVSKLQAPSSKLTRPNLIAAKTDKIPMHSSIKNVLIDILLLQFLHFPFSNKKEIIGNMSNLLRLWLQEKQKEFLFQIERPVLYLSKTTFIKLPIEAPKKKLKKKLIIRPVISIF